VLNDGDRWLHKYDLLGQLVEVRPEARHRFRATDSTSFGGGSVMLDIG
jgi:hypothetical protein